MRHLALSPGPRLVADAPLSPEQVVAYLDRLGVAAPAPDLAGLTRLQAAHVRAVPFHNLLLLRNDGRPYTLPPLGEAVEAAIAGLGGNCDRTTPPFTALLQALGFDAHLAAATVGEPGDHFVCIVHIGCRHYLCDVGNGHPYLQPWDLDGPVQEQSFCGWRFRLEPRGVGGPTVHRLLPDGRCKRVYTVDPTPRAYTDFAAIVEGHYTQAGFGPFLSGLRAVRVGKDRMISLRDDRYQRDSGVCSSVRRLVGTGALESALTGPLGLPQDLVSEVLAVLARRRPELCSQRSWLALGRGRAGESRDLERPPREAVPDVLLTVATVGREAAMRRLLHTLSEERRRSKYPGRIGVIVVENHTPRGGPPEPPPEGVQVHRIHIDDCRAALRRAAVAGVLPRLEHHLPVPIGAAREAQLAALHLHLKRPLEGLPHPAEHPTVVWMVDDDVAFVQLDESGRIDHHTNLLFRAARAWATLPQHSVVLGTFTGDPPIPGLDGLGGQLDDLCAAAEELAASGPQAPWRPCPTPPRSFDAYYDLSESADAQRGARWPYAPALAGTPSKAVALGLLADLPRLLDGQQLTRPLTWAYEEQAPSPSLRRGGNTLYLDLDALFRWPTPVLETGEGVMTRRSDTLWAALAQAEDPGAVVELTLPLLHGREGQAGPTVTAPASRAASKTAAQICGVALARALGGGTAVEETLRRREARVARHRQDLLERLDTFEAILQRLRGWRDAEVEAALDEAEPVIEALRASVRASIPRPSDPQVLDAFLGALPAAVQAWRGGW